MSLLRRAASNARELRYVAYGQGDPYAIPSNGSLANYATSGVAVDSNSALGLAAVWSCVRIISTVIASMPVYTAREVDGRLKRVDDHPLVANPFGTSAGIPISRQTGIEQMMGSLLLRGNSVNVISEIDGTGTPTQIVPVSPDFVRIDQEVGTGRKIITVAGKPIDLASIVHVLGMSMPGMVAGMSPISYLRETIGIGLATDRFASTFFGNGTTMSGVIEVDTDLDPDAARQLKERFQTRHGGLRNAHTIGVLTGGATFKPITVAPNDAQFLESRQFSVAQIAMIYGVPPHLIGNVQDVSAAWGMGIEPQNMAFLTYTLRPWITRLEEAFTNLLPAGLRMVFDTNDLLRTDSQSRARFYNASRTAAWMTPNEIRVKEGLEPVEGGDDISMPLNSAHNGQNDQTDVNANQVKE